MKLAVTTQAVRQIDDIIDYIAQRSPLGALNVRTRLKTVTSLVAEPPLLGQATDVEGVCRISASPAPYMIYYRVAADIVSIQRVRHASRDPAAVPRRA